MRARLLLAIMLLVAGHAPQAQAQAIATDSRIKTFVYNPNEVYTITTHTGYQSNIEFAQQESVSTISVGDKVGWQIIPAGRRLFIRAMEEGAHTNMTIVTNLRAYQFDLRAAAANASASNDDLTYVVRFYYPQEDQARPVLAAPPPAAVPPAPLALAPAPLPPSPPPAAPIAKPAPALPSTATLSATAPDAPNAPTLNYRYTYSGPTDIAPTKIYDDGTMTYFKIPGGQDVRIAVITAKGDTLELPTQRTSDGLVAVNAIAPRFSVSQGRRQVVVYNESREQH